METLKSELAIIASRCRTFTDTIFSAWGRDMRHPNPHRA